MKLDNIVLRLAGFAMLMLLAAPYLRAASAMEMTSLLVNGEQVAVEGDEVRVRLACGSGLAAVQVQFDITAGAISSHPEQSFVVEVPRPGVYTEYITVTDKALTMPRTYKLVISKPFEASNDIVAQKGDVVLIASNNRLRNGDYVFARYNWYKTTTGNIEDAEHVGTGQNYYASIDGQTPLDTGAYYFVELTTNTGDILNTCPQRVERQPLDAQLYPSPLAQGENLNIRITSVSDTIRPDDATATLRIFSSTGMLLRSEGFAGARHSFNPGLLPGNYMVNITSPQGLVKSFAIAVQ